MVALCDVLRLEMRARGVTVGSVHPAIFRTPLIGDALSTPAASELVNDFTGVFKTVPPKRSSTSSSAASSDAPDAPSSHANIAPPR